MQLLLSQKKRRSLQLISVWEDINMIMMYSHVLGAKAEVDDAPTSAAAAASMVLRLNIMVLVVGMYFLLQRRLIMAAITARFMEWAKITQKP